MSNSTRSSSSSSSYDERFVVPLEASRRGAHRARVSPVMAVLPVLAVVGIVVGAIALVYLFFGGLGGSDVGTGATVTAPPSVSPSASGVTSEGPSLPSSDGASGTADGSASSTLAPGAIDKSLTVDVFNGTSPVVNGLARKAGTKLTAAGWTLGDIKTWTGTAVSGTTVFYGRDEERASAQSVAKSLGRGRVLLSAAKAGDGLTVVVGNDFPGAEVRSSERTAGASSTQSTASRTAGASSKTSSSSTSAGAEKTKTSSSDDD